MITLEEAVKLVWYTFEDMIGGEIYVKKIPSMKVIDIAAAIAPGAKLNIIGIRPGEKLHEQMIGPEDSNYTYEYPEYFKILPAIHNWDSSTERIRNGVLVKQGFEYSSNSNPHWMSASELKNWISENENKIGEF